VGIVKNDEVVGYHVHQQIVCSECIEPNEVNELRENHVIIERDIEEDLFFCDRCGEKL
jgi:hypothetical protein